MRRSLLPPDFADDSALSLVSARALGPVGSDPLLKLLLGAGGDERLAIDPETGRNRYGIPLGPANDEVWFSSSTASAVTPRGYAAARDAMNRVISGDKPESTRPWFDALRARVLALFGTPGADAVFSASGTDAELIVLALVRARAKNPLVNIVTAPGETGRGVMLAAAGRHFNASAPFAQAVVFGAALEGFGNLAGEVESVEIRDPQGAPLDAQEIDRIVERRVRTVIADGGDILLHVLDSSKTGLAGLSRQAAAALMAEWPGRVFTVVDACQLRCSQSRIRADLEAGFLVTITGSKFAGGPPFSGAVLVPRGMADNQPAIRLPEGLSAYCALMDWPPGMRAQIDGGFGGRENLGLGLRWEAALAELEPYFAIDEAIRSEIVARFGALVRHQLSLSSNLELADRRSAASEARTIFPILVRDSRGGRVTSERVYRALRNPELRPADGSGGRVFHVGQPVAVGARDALRVCLSAPLIVDTFERAQKGRGFGEGLAPIAQDLSMLFDQWRLLAD